MTWVVTGGAGYIGAHVVRAFQASGMDVAVIDDLSTGHRRFVPEGVPFLEADITATTSVAHFLRAQQARGVVHVAGYKYAGESVRSPLLTYRINVQGTVSVLEAMQSAEVGSLVFSSSAAVYGTPESEVVTEDTALRPESPYGESKLIGEWLLADQGRAADLRHTSLRYFNVVGSGSHQVWDSSPHNLFPLVFDALQQGERPRIFGDDYPTEDGTCVRDYVHVSDVAAAHVTAARRLAGGDPVEPVYNLGSGAGTSVRSIMDTVRKVTGVNVEPLVKARRPGDPARIVADGSRAARDLEWRMRHSLEDTVLSAWRARAGR